MKVRVEATSTATAQLDELDAWWRTNRAAAANQVRNEYNRLVTLLTTTPSIGVPYKRRLEQGIRWLRLRKTPYLLYYRHDPGTDLVLIVAVQSGVTKAGRSRRSG